MPTTCIRDATPNDISQILRFIIDLAVYEHAEAEVKANEATLAKSIFGPDSKSHALICEIDGQAVGFALYFYSYSTWQAKNGIYLEDLYVSPEHRGQGAGKALLQYIANIAVQNNCGRFEWSVLDWNQPAIDVYEAVGAKPLSEWIRYRLDGEALHALAKNNEAC